MRPSGEAAEPQICVTKRFEFSAAHRAYRDDLSRDENRRLYGGCAGQHGDGHNFLLEVTVVGAVARETGMVIDIGELKRIVVAEVIDRFDHKHLNLDTDDFTSRVATVENLAIAIWERLVGRLPDRCRLARVRLAKDATTSVEYAGEEVA